VLSCCKLLGKRTLIALLFDLQRDENVQIYVITECTAYSELAQRVAKSECKIDISHTVWSGVGVNDKKQIYLYFYV